MCYDPIIVAFRSLLYTCGPTITVAKRAEGQDLLS